MSEVITPSCNNYNVARQEWNRAINKYPTAIIYCKNYKDIRNSILFARKNNLKIRIRSGGHNYEGFSTGNETLIIDISNLNEIQIDSVANTVTLQGGIFLGQLYNFISSYEYPFAGGSCSTIGVSGLVSGGGWGYSCRYLGLACDSLIEVKLIDYRGCIITANSSINSDLFWAYKGGGGGNFGVVILMTFKLSPRVHKVTYFNIYYNNPSKESQIKFLDTWQNWIDSAPNEINMKGSIVNSADDGIYIVCTGLLYDNPEKLNTILTPFSLIDGFDLVYDYTSFLQASQLISSVYPQYEYFSAYSRFVSRKYSYDILNKLVNMINKDIPKGSKNTFLNVYGLGGKIQSINKYDTAFYYRNSNYILSIESNFENNSFRDNSNIWIAKNSKHIYPITDGSYINFPYLHLPNYLYDYYGENALSLQYVKHKYDPLNIFNFPQSIK